MKPSEVISLCAKAKEPGAAADLIAKGATLKQVRARLECIASIRATLARARSINPAIAATIADELIAAGCTEDEARSALMDKIIAAQSDEIRNSHMPDAKPAGGKPDHGWPAAIAKVTT